MRARVLGSRPLTEDAVKDLLRAHGIPTPRYAVITNEEAIQHLEIGYPVVLKVCSPNILHKTEVGGVKLGIKDAQALIETFRDMRVPFPTEAFLVERMEEGGLELIVGLVNDTTFGLCVMVGLGGILTEVLEDVSFRALPITPADAHAMIEELHAHKVLEGFRGHPVDREAVIDLLLKVSKLGVAFGEEIDQLDLNPVIVWPHGLCVVDAKLVTRDVDQVKVSPRGTYAREALKPILYPRSVAVIGASNNPQKDGYLFLKNLIDGGFGGKIFPINPHSDEILHLPANKSVLDIADDVDLAVVVVPLQAVPQAVKECGEKGVRGLVIVTAGFDEVGDAGKTRSEDLRSLLRNYRMAVLGPNIMGIVNMNIDLCAVFALETLMPRFKRGGIGLITQSGSVGSAFLQNATHDGIGFSLYVPLGNKLETDEADWIQFMNEDPAVSVIAVQLEGIRDGERFLQAIRNVGKPMVVFKTGRTRAGEKAARSHTAALAANDKVFAGVLRQHGIIQVDTSEELYDLAKALEYLGHVTGKRLLIVESSGGLGIIASDMAERTGLELPDLDEQTKEKLREFLAPHASLSNPLDTASIVAEPFEKIAELGIVDDYDVLLLIFGDPVENSSNAVRLFKERSGTPMIVAFSGGGTPEEVEKQKIINLGVPVFPCVERAMAYFRFLTPANQPGSHNR